MCPLGGLLGSWHSTDSFFLWSALTPPRQVTKPRLDQGFFIPGDTLYCLRHVRCRPTVSISSTVPSLRIQQVHILALQFPVVNGQAEDINKTPKFDVLLLPSNSALNICTVFSSVTCILTIDTNKMTAKLKIAV